MLFLYYCITFCEILVKPATKNLASRESYANLARERRREQAREKNDCCSQNEKLHEITLIG